MRRWAMNDPSRERRKSARAANPEVALGFANTSEAAINGFAVHIPMNSLYERNLTICGGCNIRRTYKEFGFGTEALCETCRVRRGV